MRASFPIYLKCEIFNQCAVPTRIYGCKTWKYTKAKENKLRSEQRVMGRAVLGITLRDRKMASWVREQSGVKGILVSVKGRKWNWVGQIARKTIDGAGDGKRGRGRQDRKWRDETEKNAGTTWQRLERSCDSWRMLREALVQQWTSDDCWLID